MKRKFAAALCLLFLSALTACGGQDIPAETAPAIRPTVFSQDAQDLLDVLGGDDTLAFFDYTVEAPIRSISTEVWKYEDGSWKQYGHVFGNIDPGEYRMGFRLTPSGYEIFDISDTGHNTYTYQDPIDFDGSGATISTQLGDPREIVCGEEIPLWIKPSSDSSAVGGVTPGDFRSIDCTAGLALTVTFSDLPID